MMSNDWQVGDLALCVKQGPWEYVYTREIDSSGPRCGEVHLVVDVCLHLGNCLGLGFSTWPMDLFLSERFIKVTPSEEDEFDRETIDLYLVRPLREPVA